MSEVDTLAQYFQNAPAIFQAATDVGMPLWIAAAKVEKESHGYNVYGNDPNGVFNKLQASIGAISQLDGKEHGGRSADGLCRLISGVEIGLDSLLVRHGDIAAAPGGVGLSLRKIAGQLCFGDPAGSILRPDP